MIKCFNTTLYSYIAYSSIILCRGGGAYELGEFENSIAIMLSINVYQIHKSL